MSKKVPRDAADELHAHRHDPDEWSDEPVQMESRPSRTAVVSFRLPRRELDALEQAAEVAHESLSEYVRKAVLLRRGVEMPLRPIAPTSIAMAFVQVNLMHVGNARNFQVYQTPATAAPRTVVQDEYVRQF